MSESTEKTLDEHLVIDDQGDLVWVYRCSCGDCPRKCGHWGLTDPSEPARL